MRQRPAWNLKVVAAAAIALASPLAPMAAPLAAGQADGRPGVEAAPASASHPKRIKRPWLSSDEYLRSWGLQAIDAGPAVRAGASGRGVTIALVDCGLQDAQPEVAMNVSPRSVDLIAERRAPPLGDRHASDVAGPLGSAFDHKGLLGVAYNATLLSVRADMDGGYRGQCAFRRADLVRALDYAVQEHARVIVLPMEAAHPLGAAFEAALQLAVDGGAVVVVAAGNETAASPAWPARYAADPRFAGAVLAVGAVDYDGVITGWSNRAGDTRASYLMAPGEKILTDCGVKVCSLVSGTSFATAYVAGAVALVMEADPKLAGREAAEIVMRGARDAGAPGVDGIYGRGVLDVARAVRLANQASSAAARQP